MIIQPAIGQFPRRSIVKSLILLTIIIFSCNFSFAYNINYTFINKTDAPKPYIHVIISFKTANQRTTQLNLPSGWVNQTELYNCIKNIKCETENTSIDTTENKAHLLLNATENTQITLSYDLISDFEGDISNRKYFRPIIKADCFYFLGVNGLIIPETIKTDKLTVSLNWKGFNKTTLVNSFGTGQVNEKITTDYNRFHAAVFAGGNLRLQPVINKTHHILVAVYGKFAFSDDSLNRIVDKIITNEHDFWDDHDYPYFLVTAFPCRNAGGGTGYTNSFSIFYEPQLKMEDGLIKLLYHECFHKWNGQKIDPGDGGEFTCKWFIEGFTDYYAEKLSIDNKLQSQEDYVKYINNLLNVLYISPKRNADNRQIEELKYTDPDIYNLPYVRGPLFALLCNNQMMRETKGKYNLDNVMREILRLGEQGKPFTLDMFLKAIAKFDPMSTIPEQLNQIIINGRDFNLNDLFDHDRYSINYKDVTVVDPGFDFNLTQKSKKIIGLKNGSNAEKAGLKEGMEGQVTSYWSNDATKAIKVQVKQDNTLKTITYFPNPVKPIRVPYITKI